VLTEEQIALLERHSTDFRRRHVEASRPGELLIRTRSSGAASRAWARSTSRSWLIFCSLAFAKSTRRRCR
jgi:hypothetical protein